MRVDVAFTPADAEPAQVAIVIDVLRATSVISQALASGYERVDRAAEIDEARALRERLGEGLLGGERNAAQIEGFDVGASPREFVGEPRSSTVIFSTTNGTRRSSSRRSQPGGSLGSRGGSAVRKRPIGLSDPRVVKR